MTTIKTARFWTHINGGMVKLSLQDGQAVATCNSGPTEEGYCSECSSWTREGNLIRLEYASDGRDCDGRSSYEATARCYVSELARTECYSRERDQFGATIRLPEWQHYDARQRDYTAESMGY